jgi:hypothetical protein
VPGDCHVVEYLCLLQRRESIHIFHNHNQTCHWHTTLVHIHTVQVEAPAHIGTYARYTLSESVYARIGWVDPLSVIWFAASATNIPFCRAV